MDGEQIFWGSFGLLMILLMCIPLKMEWDDRRIEKLYREKERILRKKAGLPELP